MASAPAQDAGPEHIALPRAAYLFEIASSLSEHANYFESRDQATPQSAADKKGVGLISFLTALVTALIIFAVQISVFILLRNKLARIFKPKTYLVPERERTEAPPRNPVALIRSLMQYNDREVINKCGLDAYFFLRYLKTLLVIFIPICILVVPILVPLNYVDGLGRDVDVKDSQRNASDVPTGLDTLSWGNVAPENTSRYAAHLVLGILVIIWFCTVVFFELRVYIKVRQDYLTSAEHRLRASATTVLVSGIPKKWLSEEALMGLFDVFPGGVRNIWINRNLTQLLDKISERDSVHSKLESAETDLIKAVKKAQLKQRNSNEKSRRKSMKLESLTKKERADRLAEEDARADELARSSEGAGAGNQSEVPHTVDDGVREAQLDHDDGHDVHGKARHNPVAAAGKGLKHVTGKGGRGVNNALTTNNGFLDLGQEEASEPAPVAAVETGIDEPDDAKLANQSFEGHRTTSAAGSLGVCSSTQAIQPEGRSNTMANTVTNTTRKVENVDDMYIQQRPRVWQFWKPPAGGYASPVPQGAESEDYLANASTNKQSAWTTIKNSLPFMGPKLEEIEYSPAYESECSAEAETEAEAEWTKYVSAKDRPTHHLPLFGQSWLFGMPFVTKKVDTIYWCRQELARLNLEIEEDQKYPERFPLMNSAFIQFNHQVAAHMACQSVVHHLPKHMAPRVSEISPKDVKWDNMAINWWQQWVRSFAVITIVVAMTVLWAIPVAWTAALSKADILIRTLPFLKPLEDNKAVGGVVKGIAGVLPAALLALLLLLPPIIFGLLAGFNGAKTGAQRSEFVQRYYFVFLFVQVFLVVSIASFFASSLNDLINNFSQLTSVETVLTLLATNLPGASTYFFSYMILQALSTSTGTLLQTSSLIMWFILAPLFDSTAREKWRRNTTLDNINWGSFFPFYTNFACIGLIYCIIAPIISIFVIITFSLLWVAQRYAMLYVKRFELDTGGVMYPRALNQTFTGIYFMELCMAGLFFIVRDAQKSVTCKAHGIIMIVVFLLTILYQVILNQAFSPLFRALPITYEDEAVIRDEAFQRAQDARFGLGGDTEDDDDEDLADDEKAPEFSQYDKDIELQKLPSDSQNRKNPMRTVGSWAMAGGRQVGTFAKGGGKQFKKLGKIGENTDAARYRRQQRQKDLEAQKAIGNALYGNVHDDIEDLTPRERDMLTQHAFLHAALRARRPAVWLPRDDLGVSDDEVRRTKAFSDYIWISNDGTALDSKLRVVYGKNPPDFSEVDIINL